MMMTDITMIKSVRLHAKIILSLHHKNTKLLLIKIFKTKKNLNEGLMKDILIERKEIYNLRNGSTL